MEASNDGLDGNSNPTAGFPEEDKPLRNYEENKANGKKIEVDLVEDSEHSDVFIREADGKGMELCGINEDIYSLIYACKWRSQAFFFAMGVFAFQFLTIWLIFFNLSDFSDSENVLQAPPGVVVEVHVAQAFAMLLTVATQGDVVEAVSMFVDTYGIQESHDKSTMAKWFLASFLRFISGAFMLIDVFLLLIQSTNVIDLMLNFAGLEFVGEIDDIAFAMAAHGFITDDIQKEALTIGRLEVRRRGKRFNVWRRVMYALVAGGLLIGWLDIFIQQRNGDFLCKSVYAQFGDAFNPSLAYFSGVYNQNNTVVGHRVVYKEKNTGLRQFAYCETLGFWTYSESSGDPCNYIARSVPTKTFDITETFHTQWYVVDFFETHLDMPFDFLLAGCNDCDIMCLPHNGVCVDNECVCNDGQFGLNCEFPTPCEELDLDLRTAPFPFEVASDLQHSAQFMLLRYDNGDLVEVYDRPVYTFQGPTLLAIIVFSGRRWVVTFAETLGLTTTEILDGVFDMITHPDEVVQFLSEDFHGLFAGYRAYFLSDPMDVGTPSDGVTPAGVRWHRARYDHHLDAFWADETQTMSTVLLCASCDVDFNDCYNLGHCGNTTEGVCDCSPGFEGYLCELEHLCTDEGIKCMNKGKCDFFTGHCRCQPGFFGALCQFDSGHH